MSTRYNNRSNYENHQRAAELHNAASHAHRVAEQRGKQDLVFDHDHSRMAFEQSQDAHRQSQKAASTVIQDGFDHSDIAVLAHEFWRDRGRPEGSSQEDWFHAIEALGRRKDREPV